MPAEVIDLRQRRLQRHAREYARIYIREGPRMAQYYARVHMNAADREDCHDLIVNEVKRIRGDEKKGKH